MRPPSARPCSSSWRQRWRPASARSVARVSAVMVVLVAALVGWFVWALLTFVIGTKLLPEKDTQADLGQMLRVLGLRRRAGPVRDPRDHPVLRLDRAVRRVASGS